MTRKTRTRDRPSERQQLLDRARGLCEHCKGPIRASWEDHHIFFKSRHFFGTNRTRRDELWNRCPLHMHCHAFVHKDPDARGKLEELALQRLFRWIGPRRWASMLRFRRGETSAATVRAYESWRMNPPLIDVELEPGAEPAEEVV